MPEFLASADSASAIELLSGDGNYIEVGLLASGTNAPVATTVWSGNSNEYKWRNADKIDFTRTISVDGYVISISDTIKNNSGKNFSFSPYARIVRENNMKSSSGLKTGSIVYANSDLEQE